MKRKSLLAILLILFCICPAAACGQTAGGTEPGGQTYTVTFVADGETVASVTVPSGETVYPPAVGTEAGTSVTWLCGGEPFDFSAPVTGNVTVEAQFSADQIAVTCVNYDGAYINTLHFDYGSAADLSGLTPQHRYSEVYTFSGWDGLPAALTQDVTATAAYAYRSLPEELFDFVPLDDGTYGLRIKGDLDFRYMDLTGAYGLPDSFNNKPVTRIMDRGVCSNYGALNGLSYLFVPASVREIDGGAFTNFQGGVIEAAEGLQEVWAWAFCDTVAEVRLPASLTLIEPFAFYGYGLVGDLRVDGATPGVSLDPDCAAYVMEGDCIYTADRATLVYVDGYRELETFTVPATVRVLYPALFARAWSLTSVTFAGDIDVIGASCFYYINRLQTVTFNGSVAKIEGSDAEYDVRSSMPVDDLIVGAFGNLSRLTDFTLPSVGWIGDFAFYRNSFTEIVLDGVEHVGKGAFYSDRNTLEAITVTDSDNYYSPDGRSLIERGTGPVYNGAAGDTFLLYAGAIPGWYEEQKYLEPDLYITDTYTVPAGVTAIATYAFGNAHFINHLVIPEGVRTLPGGMLTSSTSVGGIYDEESGTYTTLYFGLTDISLPSTLETIGNDNGFPEIYSNEFLPAMQLGQPFTGFLWPNGCNLREIAHYAVVTNGSQDFTVPASVEDYGSLGLYAMYGANINAALADGRYLSIDGWLFERVGEGELRLVQIPHGAPSANGTLVFPDTGDDVIVSIGDHAAYGLLGNFQDLAGVQSIVFPEGLRTIEANAFYNCGQLTSVEFPASLEYIGDTAFGLTPLLTDITFNGILPPGLGDDVFGFPQRVPLMSATIHIPNGSYDYWFDVLYEYGTALGRGYGDNYFLKLEGPSVTYRFHTDAEALAVADIAGSCLTDLPATVWQGEGNKYFHGWYTADGSDGWGTRVGDFAAGTADRPFFGQPDGDGVVHLYARFGDEPYEDGSDIAYAFVLTETPRQLTLDAWQTTYFAFTPEESGRYTLVLPFDWVAYSGSGCGTYDAATDTLSIFYPSYDRDEDGNITNMGWDMTAGQTYYFYFNFMDQNVFTGESGVPAVTCSLAVTRVGDSAAA